MKMRLSHGCNQHTTLEMLEQTGLTHVILSEEHAK